VNFATVSLLKTTAFSMKPNFKLIEDGEFFSDVNRCCPRLDKEMQTTHGLSEAISVVKFIQGEVTFLLCHKVSFSLHPYITITCTLCSESHWFCSHVYMYLIKYYFYFQIFSDIYEKIFGKSETKTRRTSSLLCHIL